ncbi:hypothetical protein K7X08_024477 [Anisodus acutangulus]|uniref:NAC domain-containing protein n=1 Tax=Anisodus acutangulus TaxID=402998 RepID=A0A9Q1MAX4_9SOLA|nr:hypothetical protein K7X08_024477 [Anisodus acutangulus]
MSTTIPAHRLVMGVRFHPTEVELINYLKRFLRGESLPSQCPIRLAEIYGDQPPSAIFGEEKVGYFISPLKKREKSDERKNDIPKQDFVVCRIKKIIKEKKVKDVAVTEQDVDGIIDATLHGPDDNCTTHPAEDQVMDETDKWDLIINGVCDQQVQGHGADGNINEFWEAMNGILEDISIDIPDDLWLDDQSPLLLDTNENI